MFIYIRKITDNNNFLRRFSSNQKWRLIFFGSDDFAVASLRKIFNVYKIGSLIDKLEISTTVSGRSNEVNDFALKENLQVHAWPCLADLKAGSFDLGVVVSFGHLIPESVINVFPLGMINIHGSLLPRWRGAAPIIHTLLHGDTQTGVTLMRIRPKHFDIGEIIMQSTLPIGPDETRIDLHESLSEMGANLLVECLHGLPDSIEHGTKQNNKDVTYAPKVTSSIGHLKWDEMTSVQVYNLYRAIHGLHPLLTQFHQHPIRMLDPFLPVSVLDPAKIEVLPPGYIEYLKNCQAIKVWCKDSTNIYFKSIKIKGKRTMTAADFNNGYLKKITKDLHYFIDVR